jgi:hypothetical protein
MKQWRLVALVVGLLSVASAAEPPAKEAKPGPRQLWTPDADQWRVERWAGNETSGGYLQGPATEAGVSDVSRPAGMAFDREGNAVFTTHSCLVMRTREGQVRFLAGVPAVMGHRDGDATRALFCHPEAVVHDGVESFFINDRGNFCIRRLYCGAKGWLVETVAGVPGKEGRKDGPAAEALFTDPCNLGMDEDGRLYTFDRDFVRRIADGQVVTLNPKGGGGYQDGPVETAKFNLIMGAACCGDAKGHLYVADRWNVILRCLDLKTDQVTTVCGVPKQHYGHRDGPAADCSFHDSPGYVVYDPVRNCLYTSGVDEQCVRRFDLAERLLRSLAGKIGGSRGTCGPAKEAGFAWVNPAALDPRGDIYTTDGGYPVVRRLYFDGPDKPTPVAPAARPLHNKGFVAKESETATEAAPAAKSDGLVAGPEITPCAAADAYQRSPACAYGKDAYLLVWQDGWSGVGGDSRILGLRLSVDGQPLDKAPIVIAAAPDQQEEPAAAFSGGTFLVVWQDLRNGAGADVYAARLDSDGKVLDRDGFAVAAGPQTQARPRVAATPDGFLVVWQEIGQDLKYRVRAARVGRDGKVLDPEGIALSGKKDWEVGCNPDVACSGERVLVVWERPGVLAQITGAVVEATTGKRLAEVPPHGFWGGPGRPRVAANGADFLTVSSRTPYPDYWGWGGPGGIHAARVLADGSAPDRQLIKQYDYRRWPNVLDVSGKDMPGLWPHRYAAVAWDGRQYVAVWVRAHVRNKVMLCNFDLIGARIRFAPEREWDKPDGDGKGVPLASSPVSEGAPILAAGPSGRLLLAYETFPPDGRLLIACRALTAR